MRRAPALARTGAVALEPAVTGRGRALTLLAAAALAASTAPALGAGSPERPSPLSRVVVMSVDRAGDGVTAAAAAVRAAGGRVVDSLPVVHGVSADLPAGTTLAPEWTVVPDRAVGVAAEQSTTEAAGPVSTVRATLGLGATGAEGRGATVAVVDTGIADVPDLASRVAGRLDATGKGAGDGFGHGTFMAGLIAGTGASSNGAVTGVAPRASLVDVRVADDDGTTDLVTVLRGLQLVAANAQRYDIDVVSLSLSSDSPLPYQLDPLTVALETLWQHGILVVVPAGNDGPDAGSVTSPGIDPTLLTAGAVDEGGTADRRDDSVPTWSSRGPTWQGDGKPDVAAPGTHVLSLRAPGSVVDRTHPEGRVGNGYFRGSGTSMSTAVTAGAAAALLADRPHLRPDTVKALLTGTAYPAPGLDRTSAGAGGLDLQAALAARVRHLPTADDDQGDPDAAHGPALGSRQWRNFLDAVEAGDAEAASRAWARLDAASRAWASRAWAGLDPASRAWASRAWAALADTWADADTSSDEWLARFWASRAWASRAWASRAWASRAWASRAWASRAWASRAWADEEWLSRAWAGDSWDSRAWASRAWASRAWASRAWASRAWS